MEVRPNFLIWLRDFSTKNMREFFGVIGLIWFKLCGKIPIFLSLFLSLIFLLPIATKFRLSIGQTFLLYFSITLSLSSILLIHVSAYEKILLIFMHYDIANCMFFRSPYAILLFFAEIWYIFTNSWTKNELLMLAFSFISACTTRLSFDAHTEKPFTLKFSFFIGCISAFFVDSIDPVLFMFSFVASLPRRGLPCPPQKLTISNWKTLIYLFLSVGSNGYILYYSTKHGALTLASDAMTSICSNVAIIGAVMTDVASRMLGTSKFSYGFSSSLLICDLAAAILQIIAATQVIFEAIENLIQGIEDDEEGDKMLVILAIGSLAVNIFGALFLDNFETSETKESCSFDGGALTIICELISSSTVVFSSFLMSVFNMKFIDPYMSLLIGILIYIVSFPAMIKSLRILNLRAPFIADYEDLGEKTNSQITGNCFSVSEGRNAMYVKVEGSHIRLNRIIRRFARRHSVSFIAIENVN